jgi:hypothetical protein
LEFAGLRLADAAAVIRDHFGGEIRAAAPSCVEVDAPGLGVFRVELDAALLQDKRYEEILAEFGIDLAELTDADAVERFLVGSAALVVPAEVVCPPLPLDRLTRLEGLREALSAQGAKGTSRSLLYAFGMQVNAEVASFAAADILAGLRAFLLLYEWIVVEEKVNLTRRLLPYVNPFADDYVEHVLAPDYRPSLTELMDDYLAFNPTRNRPLDLLPLFAWLDEERVLRAADEPELVNKRPAWHYRLPDCLIDEPAWSLAAVWNSWVQVEYLAADRELLAHMSRDYLTTKESFLDFLTRQWPEKVRQWRA